MEPLNKKVLFTSHTANFHKFNRPFMRMLKQQGYIIHYASAGDEIVFDTDKHFDVPFERSPFKFGNIKAYYKLRKIINNEKYDLIHTHTPMGSVVTRLAASAARKRGTRVIYTAHGFHFFNGAPIANWLIYYPIEKLMARFTDTLITINREDYERAKSRLKTDVRYVPGVGVDLKKFGTKLSLARKAELRESLGLTHDDYVMIYTAELNANKNQGELIEMMSELAKTHPDTHLLLAGSGSWRDKYEAMVNTHSLQKNVHFLGYRGDVSELLQISNLAVSVSRREGLPVNIIEAMCVGLPIVATDCRGNRDLVSDGSNGYVVKSNDKNNLISKILFIKNSPKLTVSISSTNKKAVDSFALKKIEAMMRDIYLEELSRV